MFKKKRNNAVDPAKIAPRALPPAPWDEVKDNLGAGQDDIRKQLPPLEAKETEKTPTRKNRKPAGSDAGRAAMPRESMNRKEMQVRQAAKEADHRATNATHCTLFHNGLPNT